MQWQFKVKERGTCNTGLATLLVAKALTSFSPSSSRTTWTNFRAASRNSVGVLVTEDSLCFPLSSVVNTDFMGPWRAFQAALFLERKLDCVEVSDGDELGERRRRRARMT